MDASGRPSPSRALELGRHLAPAAVVLALVLAVPLALAGQRVAALIFGFAPVACLGWVTFLCYRVEKGLRGFSIGDRPED